MGNYLFGYIIVWCHAGIGSVVCDTHTILPYWVVYIMLSLLQIISTKIRYFNPLDTDVDFSRHSVISLEPV